MTDRIVPTSDRAAARPAARSAVAYIARPGDRRVVASACRRLELELVDVLQGGGRHGSRLAEALDAVAQRRAGCLIVRRLADLDGQTGGVARLLERVTADGVRLVVLDIGLDTSEETGALALRRRPHREAPWAVHAEPAAPAEGEPEAAEPEAGREPEPAAAAPVLPGPEPIPPGPEPAPPGPEPMPPGPEPAPPEPEPKSATPEPEPAAPPPPAPPPRSAATALRALGYACAAGAQDGGAADLTELRGVIEQQCAAQGLDVVEVIGDREPRDGKALDRPGLSHALRRIAAGDARCLVVARLDHLSHSVAELGRIIAWLNRQGVRLIAIDMGMDTATDAGLATARALASVGDWERERLSQRTRAGLEAARQKRRAGSGAEAERVAALRRRIAGMRADGMTLQAIADVLNAEGVPTQRGGAKWRPSSVQTAAGYKRPTRRRRSADLPDAGARPTGRQ